MSKRHGIQCVEVEIICHACGECDKVIPLYLDASGTFEVPCVHCKTTVRGRIDFEFDNNELGAHGDTRTHTRTRGQ